MKWACRLECERFSTVQQPRNPTSATRPLARQPFRFRVEPQIRSPQCKDRVEAIGRLDLLFGPPRYRAAGMNLCAQTPRKTAQSHRTDCPASGPLIARSLRPYGAPPPLTEELGGSHRGSVRSGVSTRIWLSRPAALERGAVVVEVGLADCHGTTTAIWASTLSRNSPVGRCAPPSPRVTPMATGSQTEKLSVTTPPGCKRTWVALADEHSPPWCHICRSAALRWAAVRPGRHGPKAPTAGAFDSIVGGQCCESIGLSGCF